MMRMTPRPDPDQTAEPPSGPDGRQSLDTGAPANGQDDDAGSAAGELALLLENAMEGVQEVGADGTILRANDAELAMLGYDRKEYVGRNIAAFHVDGPVVNDLLARSLRGESVPLLAARLYHKGGSMRHVELRTLPRHEGGRLVYTRVLTRDITAVVALAAEREAAIEAKRDVARVLERRARQQATVARLGSVALATPEVGRTLDLLAREVAATLGVEFCSVVERSADGRTFQPRATFGGPTDGQDPAPLPALGNEQAEFTLNAAAPVVCSDLRTESRFAVHPLLIQRGVMSTMGVVVKGRREPWGVVAVHAAAVRAFADDDVRFLEAASNLMALAVERDRVETTLRHRTLQQATMATLGKHALAAPHMDEFFGAAVRDMAATLEVDICKVLQRDLDDRTLLLRAGVGWRPGVVGTARVSADPSTPAGFTLRSPGPVVITDLRTESRFAASSLLAEHGVVSGMSVLIPGRNGPFGVLGAYSRAARVFTQEDVYFLQAVANLLALAIERHASEGQLRRHRDDLEGLVEERTVLLAASNRELEAFSYTISHDLRAPLRGINGLSKILLRKHGSALSPDAQEMLQQVADGAVRMGSLIESILALSRLGSVSLMPVPVDVSAAATSILEMLQASDPERKVAWSVEPGLHAYGDEGLLRLMLDNLLGNAWKFTGRTRDARITVAHEVGGFRIEDNGAGFDEAHARELFQPFHRLHGTDEFEGTGIGLATVSRIVRRHAGRVWGHGEPGKGATFHVTLPTDPPPVLATPPRTHVGRPSAAPGP